MTDIASEEGGGGGVSEPLECGTNLVADPFQAECAQMCPGGGGLRVRMRIFRVHTKLRDMLEAKCHSVEHR